MASDQPAETAQEARERIIREVKRGLTAIRRAEFDLSAAEARFGPGTYADVRRNLKRLAELIDEMDRRTHSGGDA